MTYWLDTEDDTKIVKTAAQLEEERLNRLRILNYDLKNFILLKENEGKGPDVLAEGFCRKWTGYGKTYGVAEIEMKISSGGWRRA